MTYDDHSPECSRRAPSASLTIRMGLLPCPGRARGRMDSRDQGQRRAAGDRARRRTVSQWEYAQGKDWSAYLAPEGSDLRSQWLRAWLVGPLGTARFEADENQFARAVFADDFRIFRKALVWFQAERRPQIRILAGASPQEQRQRFAVLLGWPSDFAAWRRLIDFILRRISDIPQRLYPEIISIFEVWQNALAFATQRLPPTPSPIDAISTPAAPTPWVLGDGPDLGASESSGPATSEHRESSRSSRPTICSGSPNSNASVTMFSLTSPLSLPSLLNRFPSQSSSSHWRSCARSFRTIKLPEKSRSFAPRSRVARRPFLAKPEAERTRQEQMALSAICDHRRLQLPRLGKAIDRRLPKLLAPSPLRELYSLFQSSPDEGCDSFGNSATTR